MYFSVWTFSLRSANVQWNFHGLGILSGNSAIHSHSNRNLLVNGMHWRRLLRMVNETFYKAPALYFWVISLHQKLPSVALPSREIKSATLKDMASKSPVVADHTTEPERCLTALQCGQWGRFWSVNTDTYTVYSGYRFNHRRQGGTLGCNSLEWEGRSTTNWCLDADRYWLNMVVKPKSF